MFFAFQPLSQLYQLLESLQQRVGQNLGENGRHEHKIGNNQLSTKINFTHKKIINTKLIGSKLRVIIVFYSVKCHLSKANAFVTESKYQNAKCNILFYTCILQHSHERTAWKGGVIVKK
jgi:hypothetical protein